MNRLLNVRNVTVGIICLVESVMPVPTFTAVVRHVQPQRKHVQNVMESISCPVVRVKHVQRESINRRRLRVLLAQVSMLIALNVQVMPISAQSVRNVILVFIPMEVDVQHVLLFMEVVQDVHKQRKHVPRVVGNFMSVVEHVQHVHLDHTNQVTQAARHVVRP